MKKYFFFSENQTKKVLYCSLEGEKDKIFPLYQKELEKCRIPLIPFSILSEAKKFVGENTSEIMGVILHFNWGDSYCDELVTYLKSIDLLSEDFSLFMLFYSKSSKERKKAFLLGAKDALEPNTPESYDIMRDYFITYHGDIKNTPFSNLKIALLDDGFQHRSVFRDLDIVLVNAQDRKIDHKILPLGLLREPWKNINRSDLIILTKYNLKSDNSYLLRKLKNTNKTFVKAELTSQISSLWNKPDLELKKLIKKPGFVFAGIGDTISLIKSITELGIKISGTQFYKDHHLYNEMDFKYIYKQADRVNTEYLITTEKDWVKVQKFEIDFPVVVLSAQFKIKLEDQINDLISQKIG